ncbi:carbohydrate ABC transporter permease [Kribbella sp. GL6]|uniref:carbohydrate ABC transporter permease n=1 Tax=Kribbella sp. GL6 TaxID=3419765 RepID=UPI003D015C23
MSSSTTASRSRARSSRQPKHRGLIAGFLVLPIVLYAVFVLSPYVQAIYISLTDWTGFARQLDFVGFQNYARVAHDELFWTGLKHNLVMLAVLPVVTIGLGLFFASMLNIDRAGRGVRGSSAYKIVYFFPQVLPVAVIGVLWQFVYTPRSGLLNGILGTHHAWLGSPDTALAAVLAVGVWSSVGFYVVLFSAAMGAIPQEIYEAVALDGAGRWRTFFQVTLPLLRDTVRVGLIYVSIGALDGFAIVQLMTVGPGGPDNATEVVGMTLYRRAFADGQFGYACAMGVVMLFMTLTLAVILQYKRREVAR